MREREREREGGGERERERERESMCVFVCGGEGAGEMYRCQALCVCMCVCVCVYRRSTVKLRCACVWDDADLGPFCLCRPSTLPLRIRPFDILCSVKQTKRCPGRSLFSESASLVKKTSQVKTSHSENITT